MRGLLKICCALMLTVAFFPVEDAKAGQVVSTMRNVNAVMQARGFYLAPTQNMYASHSPTGNDLAPVQSFEIVRPRGEKVTIGRLYTSCTCVQLEASKRTFDQGERAVLNLHNVLPTPAQGQNYAIYVQITSPIRTTLRFDTFVQSSQFVSQAPIILEEVVPEVVEEMAEIEKPAEELPAAADLDTAESSVQESVAEALDAATDEALAEALNEADAAVAEATETLKIREVEIDLPETETPE